MKDTKKIVRSAAVLAAGLAAASITTANANPFAIQDLNGGYAQIQLADGHGSKAGEMKCGEGKCGSKSAAEMKCGEGKCGSKSAAEMKCGEAKCGGSKSAAEAKCGEAKCGGAK